VVLAVLLLAVAWLGISGTSWAALVAADLENIDHVVDDAVAIYRNVPPLSEESAAALRRSRNAAHVAAAQRVGTSPVTNRADLERAATDRGLVRVESDSTRSVYAGRYSLPYLTPRAESAIDSIAVRFRRRLVAAGLPAFSITISSVWRSAEDQAALAEVNANATRGRSSHEYATTFDIPYRRFEYADRGGLVIPPPSERLPVFLRAYVREESERRVRRRFGHLVEAEPAALDAALGRTLVTLENDGVLLVIREVRQPVYHVTSAR
jgi:hypothetical protein